MPSTAPLQAAGKVDLQEITLISGDGTYLPLHSYLLELNLYEDIYSGGMYGNIILSDSVGLIHRLKIVGEEYITLKIDTPSFNIPIWKTFKCCGVDNRVFARSTTTENYVIHFVSPEVFLDHYMPVQRAFEGTVEDIVGEIYTKYLQHPRVMDIKDGQLVDSENSTELSIFTECKMPVKFISPTWSPMKCMSWIASKVKSTNTELNGSNFFFFESNKRFYWGSIEDIVKAQRDSQNIVGIYVYAPGNVKEQTTQKDTITVDDKMYKNPDITRDFFGIHELTVTKNVDVLSNMQSGYLSSVHHELDITSKNYTETIYDHVVRYPYYQHTSANANGFFAENTVRVPYAHQMVGFKHVGLFDSTPNNLNEQAKDIMPIRNSMLAELNQIKMKIDVYGRTDVEIGGMLYLLYPKSGPKNETDLNKGIEDSHYSGLYIITAIHHKITINSHLMTMEIVKDSFGDVNEGKAA